MSADAISPDESVHVEEATAFLLAHAIPAVTREFRLRQEFFRHGWDVRVRDETDHWAVYATKPGHPSIEEFGSTEGNTLRLALAAAIRHGEAEPAT